MRAKISFLESLRQKRILVLPINTPNTETSSLNSWQLINEISKRKRNTNSHVPKSIKNDEGEKIQDPTNIAQALNQHFGTVGQKMANNFDIKGLDIKDPLDYIKTSHIENAENIFKLSQDRYFGIQQTCL